MLSFAYVLQLRTQKRNGGAEEKWRDNVLNLEIHAFSFFNTISFKERGGGLIVYLGMSKTF